MCVANVFVCACVCTCMCLYGALCIVIFAYRPVCVQCTCMSSLSIKQNLTLWSDNKINII